MATVTESVESRRLTTGANASYERIYNVTGSYDTATVRDAVIAVAPSSFGTQATDTDNTPYLVLDTIEVEPIVVDESGSGIDLWKATVYYKRQPSIEQENSESFDTSGGTQHITQSIQTIYRYGYAPDCGGAIGVTNDSVEGVDIVVPVFNFTERKFYADVTWLQRRIIADLTGTVNLKTFREFSSGQVLFLGASGSKSDRLPETPWEVTYQFSAMPNQQNLTVGAITNITKLGWQYMHVRYQATDATIGDSLDPLGEVGQTFRIQYPVGVYIEQVYHYGDFELLGEDFVEARL
jgi:hypothetical protein